MKSYSVEITETLQRTIKIKACDVDDAIRIAHEQYANGEIILNENDFVDVDILPSVRPKQLSSDDDIRKIIDYLWDDEERHWMECEHPSDHIFHSLRRLKKKYG